MVFALVSLVGALLFGAGAVHDMRVAFEFYSREQANHERLQRLNRVVDRQYGGDPDLKRMAAGPEPGLLDYFLWENSVITVLFGAGAFLLFRTTRATRK